AYYTCRHLDLLPTYQVFDDVHRFHLDQLGPFEPRSGRRAQAQLQLLAVDGWKHLRSDPSGGDGDECTRDKHVDADDNPPQSEYGTQPIAVRRSQALEEPRLFHGTALK